MNTKVFHEPSNKALLSSTQVPCLKNPWASRMAKVGGRGCFSVAFLLQVYDSHDLTQMLDTGAMSVLGAYIFYSLCL